jgi:hypothetical protein
LLKVASSGAIPSGSPRELHNFETFPSLAFPEPRVGEDRFANFYRDLVERISKSFIVVTIGGQSPDY